MATCRLFSSGHWIWCLTCSPCTTSTVLCERVTFEADMLSMQVAEATAHPMLTLLANSEQPLTTRYSRRLVTMCKSAAYDEEMEQQAFAEGAPLM